MSAATLIEKAALAGVSLALVDGRIKAVGEAGAIAALADQLQACKAELLQRLAATPTPPDALTWLRSFVGSDTVPLAAIRAAASDAGVSFARIESLKHDYIIHQKSLGRDYWKFARFEF